MRENGACEKARAREREKGGAPLSGQAAQRALGALFCSCPCPPSRRARASDPVARAPRAWSPGLLHGVGRPRARARGVGEGKKRADTGKGEGKGGSAAPPRPGRPSPGRSPPAAIGEQERQGRAPRSPPQRTVHAIASACRLGRRPAVSQGLGAHAWEGRGKGRGASELGKSGRRRSLARSPFLVAWKKRKKNAPLREATTPDGAAPPSFRASAMPAPRAWGESGWEVGGEGGAGPARRQRRVREAAPSQGRVTPPFPLAGPTPSARPPCPLPQSRIRHTRPAGTPGHTLTRHGGVSRCGGRGPRTRGSDFRPRCAELS